MKLLSRQEMIDLINKVMECEGTEEEQEDLVQKLDEGVLDPEIITYVFWTDMTPEEIADKALAYKPICL